MRELPVHFPHDPYCRALNRLMLTVDATMQNCYIGVTPDGESPGRDMLSRLSLWKGEEELIYTVSLEDNRVVLKAAKGSVALAIAMPNRLIIEGEGVSLMVGKGKALGMFMSGGSAVDDAYEGTLYATSGVRLRIVPRKGTSEVRSAWDLNALSDPEPRTFLHPDETGRLEAVIYETDYDEFPTDDGMTVSQAAEELGREFDAFLQSLTTPPRTEEGLHMAYIVWTALQPARRLNEQRITRPQYVHDRRELGSAMLFDNMLLAALLKDPHKAVEQMCSFLAYMDEDGLVPRQADNRRFILEAEAPLFGVVYKARPELIAATGEENYELQKKALSWWQEERWCPERKLFYYLHRYEPGCGKKVYFSEQPPVFAPGLNAYMLLWLKALEQIAGRLNKHEEAAAFAAQAEDVTKNMLSRLSTASGWRSLNILDRVDIESHPGTCMAILADEYLGKMTPLGKKLPTYYALPLMLAAPARARSLVAGRIREAAKNKKIINLRQALAVLTASLIR